MSAARGEESLPTQHPASIQAARLILGALYAAGVRDVVIAPGSRSAPFVPVAAAAERMGDMRIRVMVDERSAGFAALGIAKAYQSMGEQRAAAVIVTSGTAVANLHPAVAEADAAGIPLVVLSADRPHELVGTGASQTTQQVGIFGPVLRWDTDIPADLAADFSLAAGAIAGQVRRAMVAAYGTLSGNPGPVQINARLRPPLVPAPGRCDPILPLWDEDPLSGYHPAGSVPAAAVQASRGLIVVGDASAEFGRMARELAEFLHWPLLAEPSSGARAGDMAIAHYAAFLARPEGQELARQADRILVVGHPSLTRPITALLEGRSAPVDVLAFSAAWTDTTGGASRVIPAAAVLSAGDVQAAAAVLGYQRAEANWQENWRCGVEYESALQPAAAAACAAWEASCADHSPLMIGSSMTVRYLDDAAVPACDEPPQVFANRGLAGIDGTLATAIGLWHVLRQPIRVVVGDLTFLHDAMSLNCGVMEETPDLQILVLDDAGGAIFSTLEYPAAVEADVMKRFFTTPQRADIGAVAHSLGAQVEYLDTAQEAPGGSEDVMCRLTSLLQSPVKGLSIIHLRLAQNH